MTTRSAKAALRATLVAVFVGVVAGPACDELFAPCARQERNGFYLDGGWDLLTINSKSIPSGGFLLEDGSYLRGGELRFATYFLDAGTCTTPQKTSGPVVATYTINTQLGDTKKTESGSFAYVNATRKVTLSALGNGITGDKIDDGSLVFTAKIPLGNKGGTELGTKTYLLSFHQ